MVLARCKLIPAHWKTISRTGYTGAKHGLWPSSDTDGHTTKRSLANAARDSKKKVLNNVALTEGRTTAKE